MAYEENYPATPVGVVEVKTLPPARVIEADGAGGSVSGQDGAFMVLFRYIDRNNLSMTVPVESAARPAAKMRFFVERKVKEPLPEAPGVAVYERPAQTVLALGMRGGYTEARFREGVDTLTRWLADHPEWKASGEPYAVYWNGPFVPWFLKKSEVHLPVASVPPVPSAPPVPLVAPAGSAPGAE